MFNARALGQSAQAERDILILYNSQESVGHLIPMSSKRRSVGASQRQESPSDDGPKRQKRGGDSGGFMVRLGKPRVCVVYLPLSWWIFCSHATHTQVGDVVHVEPTSGPGKNVEGGVARVTAVNAGGLFDVKFIVSSAKALGLPAQLLSPAKDGAKGGGGAKATSTPSRRPRAVATTATASAPKAKSSATKAAAAPSTPTRRPKGSDDEAASPKYTHGNVAGMPRSVSPIVFLEPDGAAHPRPLRPTFTYGGAHGKDACSFVHVGVGVRTGQDSFAELPFLSPRKQAVAFVLALFAVVAAVLRGGLGAGLGAGLGRALNTVRFAEHNPAVTAPAFAAPNPARPTPEVARNKPSVPKEAQAAAPARPLGARKVSAGAVAAAEAEVEAATAAAEKALTASTEAAARAAELSEAAALEATLAETLSATEAAAAAREARLRRAAVLKVKAFARAKQELAAKRAAQLAKRKAKRGKAAEEAEVEEEAEGVGGEKAVGAVSAAGNYADDGSGEDNEPSISGEDEAEAADGAGNETDEATDEAAHKAADDEASAVGDFDADVDADVDAYVDAYVDTDVDAAHNAGDDEDWGEDVEDPWAGTGEEPLGRKAARLTAKAARLRLAADAAAAQLEDVRAAHAAALAEAATHPPTDGY